MRETLRNAFLRKRDYPEPLDRLYITVCRMAFLIAVAAICLWAGFLLSLWDVLQ